MIFLLFSISYFIFLTLVVAMQGTSKKWHQQIIKLGQQQPTNMFATKLYYTSTIPTYVHIRLIYTPHTHTHLIIAIDTLQTQTLIYIVSVRLLSSDFEGSKLVRFLAKNQHTQRKLLYFVNTALSKTNGIFLILFSFKNIKENIFEWKHFL